MSKSPIRILLCEDDPNLGKLLSEYMNAKGFVTTWAQDGVEGIKTFFRETFDFVILDVMMPRKDGFEVASEIRKESKSIPILFLTARSMKEDTLEGFKVGADDYMTKPFSMEELLVRINAILRRTSSIPQDGEDITAFSLGLFEFDYNKQRLSHNGETQRLTTKENELLYLKGSIPGSKNSEVMVKKSVKNISKMTIGEKQAAAEEAKKTPDKKKK